MSVSESSLSDKGFIPQAENGHNQESLFIKGFLIV